MTITQKILVALVTILLGVASVLAYMIYKPEAPKAPETPTRPESEMVDVENSSQAELLGLIDQQPYAGPVYNKELRFNTPEGKAEWAEILKSVEGSTNIRDKYTEEEAKAARAYFAELQTGEKALPVREDIFEAFAYQMIPEEIDNLGFLTEEELAQVLTLGVEGVFKIEATSDILSYLKKNPEFAVRAAEEEARTYFEYEYNGFYMTSVASGVALRVLPFQDGIYTVETKIIPELMGYIQSIH